MMVTDLTINGVRARKHYASGTKITEDGKYVEKEYMENGVLKKFNPKIGLGNNGLRCILNKQLGYVYIQDMVMECFGSPKPDDVQDWVIAHLDDNMQNDHYENLAWKLRKNAYPYIPATTNAQVKMNIVMDASTKRERSVMLLMTFMTRTPTFSFQCLHTSVTNTKATGRRLKSLKLMWRS